MCDNANYFYDHVGETLEAVGMGDKVKSTDILDVVDGYKGQGYGLTTDEDLSMIILQCVFSLLNLCVLRTANRNSIFYWHCT